MFTVTNLENVTKQLKSVASHYLGVKKTMLSWIILNDLLHTSKSLIPSYYENKMSQWMGESARSFCVFLK